MANTRKSRVPKEEQLKLINECRTSGMTDIGWCRERGIAVSTFYYWVKQLRKEAARIPAPAYGHSENPLPNRTWFPLTSYRNVSRYSILRTLTILIH